MQSRLPEYAVRAVALLGALFGGGCAAQRATLPAPHSTLAPSSGVAAVETVPRLLAWAPASNSIWCRTIPIAVPAALQGRVRQPRPDEVELEPAATSGGEDALLVRASPAEPSVNDFLSDWARLHFLVGRDSGSEASRIDLRLEGDRVTLEYSVAEDAAQRRYRLVYRLVRHDGVTCRLGAIERIEPAASGAGANLARMVDQVASLQGSNLELSPTQSSENPTWALVRGALGVSAHIVFGH